MKGSILIAGASFGYGHIKAAANIRRALQLVAPTQPVYCADICEFLPLGLGVLLPLLWRYASCEVMRPYGMLYRSSISKHHGSRLFRGFARHVARGLLRRYGDVGAFVATHSLAAAVGSELKRSSNCTLCVVATDFVLHGLQTYPNVDRYFVPPGCKVITNSFSSTLRSDRVQVTGIPIAGEFSVKRDPIACRQYLRLSPTAPVVLVSFGGAGIGARRYLDLIAAAIDGCPSAQFVFLTGTNCEFADVLRARYKCHPNVYVYGFADDTTGFYAAADMFIGKAGGLSVSEAIACQLPIGLIAALPGQEEINAEVLCDEGVASRLQSGEDVISWVTGAMRGLGVATRSKLTALARPLSSMTIASDILTSSI